MTPKEKLQEMSINAQKKISDLSAGKKAVIYLGSATCEDAAGAKESYKELIKILTEKGLADQFLVKHTGCTGRCDQEPIIQVLNSENKITIYKDMTANKMAEFVQKQLVNQETIKEWVL